MRSRPQRPLLTNVIVVVDIKKNGNNLKYCCESYPINKSQNKQEEKTQNRNPLESETLLIINLLYLEAL